MAPIPGWADAFGMAISPESDPARTAVRGSMLRRVEQFA
jgi:hypothetical protein